MTFNKHGSFYVRSSWPRKGLKAIQSDPTIFTPQNMREAVDDLGIGRVMVSSLRYWISALGLATEGRDSSGRISLELTELASVIAQEDPLFQSIGTAWLLHRNLAKNQKEATTWYWFFNQFDKTIFTKAEFLNDLKAYITLHGARIAESSLNRDFSCLKNTYEKQNFEDIANYIEEGIISYFSSLNLIQQEKKNIFRKLHPMDKNLPAEIILYSILEDREVGQNQVNIRELLEKEGYIGKVYNLHQPLLMKKLEELEKKGYISIFSRFGHNHIEVKKTDSRRILEMYYRKDI